MCASYKADGTAAPSFTTSWLSRIANEPREEQRQTLSRTIALVGGMAYLGGYETVSDCFCGITSFDYEDIRIIAELHTPYDHAPGSPAEST